jgi:hypothetical protein
MMKTEDVFRVVDVQERVVMLRECYGLYGWKCIHHTFTR